MDHKTRDIVRYQGQMETRQVDQQLEQLHEKLQAMDISLLTRKRIYSASVECLDNISRHADVESVSKEQFRRYPSSYLLQADERGFKIQVSNIVRNRETKSIEQRLKKLNSLNQEQVNELFKETLRRGASLTEKGGAGLGLVVLAKTTRESIYYRFDPIGGDHTYFTLTIRISEPET